MRAFEAFDASMSSLHDSEKEMNMGAPSRMYRSRIRIVEACVTGKDEAQGILLDVTGRGMQAWQTSRFPIDLWIPPKLESAIGSSLNSLRVSSLARLDASDSEIMFHFAISRTSRDVLPLVHIGAGTRMPHSSHLKKVGVSQGFAIE